MLKEVQVSAQECRVQKLQNWKKVGWSQWITVSAYMATSAVLVWNHSIYVNIFPLFSIPFVFFFLWQDILKELKWHARSWISWWNHVNLYPLYGITRKERNNLRNTWFNYREIPLRLSLAVCIIVRKKLYICALKFTRECWKFEWLLVVYRQLFRPQRCITDWMNDRQLMLSFILLALFHVE